MAYDSSKLINVLNLGVAGGNLFRYTSSQASSDCSVTGFFAAAGAASRNPAGGMRIGDTVLIQQTTAGPSPGKVSIHSVISATADQASTLSSTGWGANYNASLSST